MRHSTQRLEESGADDPVRCFAALLLEPTVMDELQVVQRLLRREVGDPIRWVRTEQLHLTLHFLGDVDPEALGALGRRMGEVAGRHRVFPLRLQGLGLFPERGRPRVVWVGLAGDLDILGALQRDLAAALAEFGDHREAREFHAHLTLGRVRPEGAGDLDLVGLIQRVSPPREVGWTVREVTLVRSDLHPSGAQYTILESAPLRE